MKQAWTFLILLFMLGVVSSTGPLYNATRLQVRYINISNNNNHTANATIVTLTNTTFNASTGGALNATWLANGMDFYVTFIGNGSSASMPSTATDYDTNFSIAAAAGGTTFPILTLNSTNITLGINLSQGGTGASAGLCSGCWAVYAIYWQNTTAISNFPANNNASTTFLVGKNFFNETSITDFGYWKNYSFGLGITCGSALINGAYRNQIITAGPNAGCIIYSANNLMANTTSPYYTLRFAYTTNNGNNGRFGSGIMTSIANGGRMIGSNGGTAKIQDNLNAFTGDEIVGSPGGELVAGGNYTAILHYNAIGNRTSDFTYNNNTYSGVFSGLAPTNGTEVAFEVADGGVSTSSILIYAVYAYNNFDNFTVTPIGPGVAAVTPTLDWISPNATNILTNQIANVRVNASNALNHSVNITYAWTRNGVAVPGRNGTIQPFQKGVDFVSFFSGQYNSTTSNTSLAALNATGANWVSIIVTQYVANISSPTIYQNASRTPTVSDLTAAINKAHQLGLKVMLKPHVDVEDGTWRGYINMSNESDWNNFFRNYSKVIGYYANLSSNLSVDQFDIGTELEMTINRTNNWSSVINATRGNYSGPITYSANWDSYTRVGFWNQLDYVGIDAYFPLTDVCAPPISSMENAWRNISGPLETFSAQNNRQILFTEIGYQSFNCTNTAPYGISGTTNTSQQDDAYNASLSVLMNSTYLAGLHFWAWNWNLSDNVSGYEIAGKPANSTLTAYYTTNKTNISMSTNILLGFSQGFNVSDNWSVTIIAHTTDGNSSTNNSINITITTLVPVITNVYLVPNDTLTSGGTLTIHGVLSADDTNSWLRCNYSFYRNNTNITALASNLTVSNSTEFVINYTPAGGFNLTDRWNGSLQCTDGFNSTTTFFTSSVLVTPALDAQLNLPTFHFTPANAYGTSVPADGQNCSAPLILINNTYNSNQSVNASLLATIQGFVMILSPNCNSTPNVTVTGSQVTVMNVTANATVGIFAFGNFSGPSPRHQTFKLNLTRG